MLWEQWQSFSYERGHFICLFVCTHAHIKEVQSDFKMLVLLPYGEKCICKSLLQEPAVTSGSVVEKYKVDHLELRQLGCRKKWQFLLNMATESSL